MAAVVFGAQQQAGGAAFLGRQLQAAPGDRRDLARAADNGGEGGGTQAFLHGPQNFGVIAAMHQDQPLRIEAGGGQSLAVQLAVRIPRRPAPEDGRIRIGQKADQQAGAKAERRRIAEDFVQTLGRQAVPGQGGIDGGGANGYGFDGARGRPGAGLGRPGTGMFQGLNTGAQMGKKPRVWPNMGG